MIYDPDTGLALLTRAEWRVLREQHVRTPVRVKLFTELARGGMKACLTCGSIKTLAAFAENGARLAGRRSQCRCCTTKQARLARSRRP